LSVLKAVSLFVLIAATLQTSIISNAAAESLKVVSWNLEWLSSTPSTHIEESQRSQADLNAYQQIVQKLRPNVIAFQEVNDIQVLQNILGDKYNIALSDRSTPRYQSLQHSDINQYTGVAIDRSLAHSDPEDLVLSPNRKLRFATYVVLEPKASPPIHLLSVHLKAGCITNFRAKEDSCKTLEQQSERLNRWIGQRIASQQSYLIVGDFNHDLTHPKDWMWQRIIANKSPAPVLLSRNLKSHCIASGKTKPYRYVVDHIIASPDLSADNLVQVLYSDQDQQYRLSDHCPLTATLEY
jgi:endonuclease/exonuclease/phosphatase family metal-dependent hydrolase